LLVGLPIYTYSIALPAAPLGATNDLARFIHRAALALARTTPLNLVTLFDEFLSSLANEGAPLKVICNDFVGC